MKEVSDCSIDALNARAIEGNMPVSTLMEITHRCNLRCDHCYIVKQGEPELSYPEITGIIDQLAAENCLFLTLSGGEVMLRKDFFDIARYAKKKGFALKVFSNGTLIDETAACELSFLKPIEVGISIYGSNAATHDGLTGISGSFDRSIRAFKLLRDHGVFTIMKCLVMRENIRQIEVIKTLAIEAGAILQFDPIVGPRNDGNREPLKHGLSDSDLAAFLSQLTASPLEAKKVSTKLSKPAICRAGRDSCCISPGGEVYPCVALPVPLGNLRLQKFADIWQGPEAAKLREFSFSDLHQCVACPDLDYCNRCWGLAAVESGDHLGPSYLNCRIARVRRRILAEHSGSTRKGVAQDETALRSPENSRRTVFGSRS